MRKFELGKTASHLILILELAIAKFEFWLACLAYKFTSHKAAFVFIAQI